MSLSPVSNLHVSNLRFTGDADTTAATTNQAPVTDPSKAQAPAQSPENDSFAREGAFTKPADGAVADSEPKKKSGIGKTIAKVLGGAAVIATILVGLEKGGITKVLESTENAKFMEKVSHYLASAGKSIAKYTVDPVMHLFKGAEKGVEDIAEEIK